ncbi:hypothetical protein [Cellulomonas sp. URHB0016]
MSTDLSTVLGRAVDELSPAGDPGDDVLAGILRGTRRRRARRHTVESVVGVAAAGVVGTAAWAGLRLTTPPPAVTPTHSATPSASPTPAPSPSASPTPTAATVAPDEIEGLPPTRALPPGLLATTTSGWVLTTYRSTWASADASETEHVVGHTVVLVSPTGDRYRVVDLPPEQSVTLVRWAAGATTAVVLVHGVDEDGQGTGEVTREVLDLTTGTLTPEDFGDGVHAGRGYPPGYLGLTADGAELWTVATSTDAVTSDVYRRTDDGAVEMVGGMGTVALLDPTGRRVVTEVWGSQDRLALIDVVHGGSTELDYGVPGMSCDVVGWAGTDSLLAVCTDPTTGDDLWNRPNATLFRVDVADGSAHATELTHLADDGPVPQSWSGATPSDGGVVFPMVERGEDACWSGVSRWDGDALVPVQGAGSHQDNAFQVTAVGGVVHVQAASGCSDASPSELTAHDLTSGDSVPLAPEPAAPDDGGRWISGLESWAVADARLPGSAWWW